ASKRERLAALRLTLTAVAKATFAPASFAAFCRTLPFILETNSMISTKALREQQAGRAKQANDLLTKASDEKRALTADEQTKFDSLHTEIDNLKGTIDKIERQAAVDAVLTNARDSEQRDMPREITPEQRSQALRAWGLAA